MNSWNLILATVVIFGMGVITGGLLVEHAIQPRGKLSHHAPGLPSPTATNRPPVPRAAEGYNPRQPQILSQDFVQKLDDQLVFSPAQREAIHKILACGQDQNHALWTNWTAQSRQVLSEVRQRIREQLNPEQRKQFEKILKQMHPSNHHPVVPATNDIPVLPAVTNAPDLTPTNAVDH